MKIINIYILEIAFYRGDNNVGTAPNKFSLCQPMQMRHGDDAGRRNLLGCSERCRGCDRGAFIATGDLAASGIQPAGMFEGVRGETEAWTAAGTGLR